MNLLIHDLSDNEWNEMASDYEGWEIISDNGRIRSCAGCFNCWLKTPGKCAIKDGYDHMAELISKADEVVIMSRYTYGGFSSFVKNVLDRSIGYILPFFRIYKGEMHHKPRYADVKPFRFIFRGHGLTDEDKARASKYVEAVCTNFNGKINEIRFVEMANDTLTSKTDAVNSRDYLDGKAISSDNVKTLLVNCSMRGNNSNSKKFLDVIGSSVTEKVKSIDLVSFNDKTEELIHDFLSAEKIVLAMPLYVDGIPSAPLRIMEELEKRHLGGGRKVYVVANMGFYESRQIENLLGMVKGWCCKAGFDYCGGIAIGAGEMMGQVIGYGSNGPGKYVYNDLLKVAAAVNDSERFEDIYTKSNKFPRFLYLLAANSGMRKSGKNNGLTKAKMLK